MVEESFLGLVDCGAWETQVVGLNDLKDWAQNHLPLPCHPSFSEKIKIVKLLPVNQVMNSKLSNIDIIQ